MLQRQRQRVEAIRKLNLAHLAESGDPEISTRIASYEMAYRMQTSGPELIDFSQESPQTLERYGAEPGARSFANNCLLARRMIERGVRFVQLYQRGWDMHTDIKNRMPTQCREVDRPTAALISAPLNMPWAMRSLKGVPAANSASRWTGLRSPDMAANSWMSRSSTRFSKLAVWPTSRAE